MIYHRRPTIFHYGRHAGSRDGGLELSERFVVAAAVDRVCQLFDDVPEVVKRMPGAQVTEQVDDRTYKAQLAIAVGPIRPKFDVRATIERDDSTCEGRIDVDAVDRRGGSRARAQIRYRVSPESHGAGTSVELSQHVTLSGPLAQFGRTGVLEDINAQMTRQFAACLAGKLAGPPSAAPELRQEQNQVDVVPLVAKSVFARLLKALGLRR
jgi:carbon monoxide dehydrogenase subunit G